MKNGYSRPRFPPIDIKTFEELQAHEAEILERLHSIPNGGRLLLLHPLRCLRDLNLQLSDRAISTWESAVGEDFTSATVLESAYNGVAANPNPSSVAVKFRGLLPKRPRKEAKHYGSG